MNKEVKEILKITNEFLKIPSVIEHEKPFLDFLEKKFKKLGYNVFRTKRYLVIKSLNENKKYLFSSHIDRQGFILNNKNEVEYCAHFYKKKYKLEFKKNFPEQYTIVALRYTREKLISYDVSSGKKLNKFKSLRYETDWKKHKVILDLDKKLKEEDKIFMLESKINILNNYFFAQIDNVISAAVLYYIAKNNKIKNDIIFTTREEIGKSYENPINYLNRIKRNLKIIVLDTSPYENFNNKKEGFLTLREGDENGMFDKELLLNIKKIIKNYKVPIHFKPSNTGMTELGRITSISNGKYTGITIQLPTMNYHTTFETSTFESLENYYKIIKKLIL
jgi:putative aminopeptidase FrvX